MITDTPSFHRAAATDETPAASDTAKSIPTGKHLWSAWSDYFDRNQADASSLPWHRPHQIPEAKRRPLVTSLAIFQLGESGEGSTLRRFAQRVSNDPQFEGYQVALTKFLGEENRHASTLSGLVQRLDGTLLDRQWSHGAFKKLRRLINLEFELQILMTAEFIAEAYYAILRDRAGDPVIERACERILRDEVGHLRFHGDFFATRQQTWHPVVRHLWAWQCHFIFLVTAHVVWFDHRACFQALGTTYGEFLGFGKRSIRAFMRRIVRQRTRIVEVGTNGSNRRRAVSAWLSA